MRTRRVYFLHNIDGRNCGMIAAFNKDEVRQIVRIPASEIALAGTWGSEGQRLARENPGVLFESPNHGLRDIWTRSRRNKEPQP